MFSAIYDIERGHYGQYGRYLHERHFWMTVILAFVLHMGAVGIYHLIPEAPVEEVPVNVLNVKLGGIELPESFQSASTNTENTQKSTDIGSNPEQAGQTSDKIQEHSKPTPSKEVAAKAEDRKLTPVKEVRFTREEPAVAQPKKTAPVKAKKAKAPEKPKRIEKVISKPLPKPVEKEWAIEPREEPTLRTTIQPPTPPTPTVAETKPTSEPKRYYRERVSAPESTTGSAIGNSEEESAEVRMRYTQTLSLWIDKHKIYPEEARRKGQGGQVRLRIRINRQGKIIRYILEKASGYPAIDQAITRMVDSANPVPAVPANYPDKRQYLEFIIPINFKP